MFEKHPIKIPIGPLKKGNKYYPRKEDAKKTVVNTQQVDKFDTIHDPLFD
jgi:hypothetical protein